MSTIDESDDDPIVAERDVYLSHHIARKLLFLEYIPRTNDQPYQLDDAQIKVRPNVPKVELTIPLQGCEEYICDSDFSLTLSSKKPVLKTQNCAFGVYVNDEFHLCSLPEILHMYPDIKCNTEKSDNKDLADDDENDPKPVTNVVPKIAPRVTEAEKNRELASYQYLKNKEHQDAWVDVVNAKAESHDISSIIYNSSTKSNASSEFYMSADDYFELCMPQIDGNEQTNKKNNQASPTQADGAGSLNNKAQAVSEEELVKFATEMFKSRTTISLTQFQSLVNRSFFPSKRKQELETIIAKAGGIVFSNAKPDPVYTIKAKGDSKDPLRECLVNMFLSKPALKLAAIKTQLEKNGLGQTSENDLRQVLKEYCVTKAGTWISKAHMSEDEIQKSKKPRQPASSTG